MTKKSGSGVGSGGVGGAAGMGDGSNGVNLLGAAGGVVGENASFPIGLMGGTNGVWHYPTYLRYLQGTNIPIPTCWSEQHKYNLLELADHGLKVKYTGAGKNDQDSASVRANHSIPSASAVYYFEVLVVDKGRDGFIGIGLSQETVSLNRLPGWEQQSFGYHADDGRCFGQSGTGVPYGPTFTTGDIVGCCYNMIENVVFFTKNGVSLGPAFRHLRGEYFPTIGLRTPGEIVRVNFGQTRFRFDIDQYVKEVRGSLNKKMETIDLSPRGSYSMLNSLVISYLFHHGYAETTAAFAQSVGTYPSIPEQLESIRDRKQIRDCLLAGDVDRTVELTNKLFPSVLPQHPLLRFKLGCRKFIEMVREGASHQMMVEDGSKSSELPGWIQKAVQFGQQLQDEFGESLDESLKNELEETFSLLAYPDPFKSSVSHLLDISRRESVANLLNSAILVSQNCPFTPPLETLVRQTSTILKELRKIGYSSAYLLDIPRA